MKLTLKWISSIFGITSIGYNKSSFELSMPFNLSYDNIFTLANMSQLAYEMDEHIPIENSTIKAFLFSNADNSVNIISIKGTTPPFLGLTGQLYFQNENEHETKHNYGEISTNDKLNDNLFFSCCFYKQSNIFNKHCSKSIPNENNICCKNCYNNSTLISNNYYILAEHIVLNLMDRIDFNKSTVIFTGHSLGGAIATFLGLRFNKTVVTYETPGERHFLQQFNINLNSHYPIYHFGHNADPIVTGNCGNTCWLMGYNIDTKCHIGYTCTYDAKTKLGMTEFIWRHRLKWVMDWIMPHWKDDFPKCEYNLECEDCNTWVYV